ncbi:MAG TPA: MerR family DNA-binding transcriptional regulator [Gammaproteobacteria bacterium]
MDKTFTITELAKEFNVTPRAIRFYEDQGLLTPGREGRRRVYTRRDRVRLKLILRGKRLGFPLSETKVLFELYDQELGEQAQMQYFLAKIKERRAILEQQRHDVEAVLHELDTAERAVREALRAKKASASTA